MKDYYINVNENSERYGFLMSFDKREQSKEGIQLYCPNLAIEFEEEDLQDYREISHQLYAQIGLSPYTLLYKQTLRKAKDMPKNECSQISMVLQEMGWITLWHYDNYQTRLKTSHSKDKTVTIVWSDLREEAFSVHHYDAKNLVFTEDNSWADAYKNEVFRTRNVEELRSYISEEEFQMLLDEFQDELED